MDSMVTARVPTEIKNRAVKVFKSLDTTPSQEINKLFEYVAEKGCLPDYRTEEQRLFEGRERVLDPETMTPKMRKMLQAMKRIEARGSKHWDETPFQELLDKAREERYESLLGY